MAINKSSREVSLAMGLFFLHFFLWPPVATIFRNDFPTRLVANDASASTDYQFDTEKFEKSTTTSGNIIIYVEICAPFKTRKIHRNSESNFVRRVSDNIRCCFGSVP